MNPIPPFISVYGSWPSLSPSAGGDDLLDFTRNFAKATQDRCADLAKQVNDVGAIFGSGAINDVLATGANPDMVFGDNNFYIAVSGPGAPFSVSGIIASKLSQLGQLVVIHNATGLPMTLLHSAGSITAANSFWCPGGVDLVVPPYGSVIARYSPVVSMWVIIATTPIASAPGIVSSPLISDSSAIANTASLTFFNKTYTIPAGSLAAGAVLDVRCGGLYSMTASPTIDVQLRIGGGTKYFYQRLACTADNQNNFHWELAGRLTFRTIGASASARPGGGRAIFHRNGVASLVFENELSTLLTLDTTGALVVDVGMKWSTASASDTIMMEDFIPTITPASATIA